MNSSEAEYRYLEEAASDNTVDSPFWSTLGQLTYLLSEETARIERARQQKQEIEHCEVPVEGTKWVKLEMTHPTEEISDIFDQLDSQAAEGISCALIIILANYLRSLSKAFNEKKSDLKVCDLGPSIGGAKWVDLVIASSNYVRHGDEWAEAATQGKQPNNYQKVSVDPLKKSGLDVWSKKPSFLDLVRHLQIEKWDTLFQNLSAWLLSCLPSHAGHPDVTS